MYGYRRDPRPLLRLGQLLLSDFDDLDKNMGPADHVFANLRDIHELDDVSYLTPEQRQMIQRFFSNFSEEHNSELKQRFLRLWSHLGDIYHTFNQELAKEGLAYEEPSTVRLQKTKPSPSTTTPMSLWVSTSCNR